MSGIALDIVVGILLTLRISFASNAGVVDVRLS